MFFVGIDPSLSSTAVVIINKAGSLCFSEIITTKQTGPARLCEIRERVKNILSEFNVFSGLDGDICADLRGLYVAIEHYAMGARYNREALGELGGVLRVMLFEKGFPYIEVPPVRLKQFATNKAFTEKDHILLAVYKKWGIEFKRNDEADAFILAQMARAIKMTKGDQLKLTAYEREVIEKILNPAKKEKKTKSKKSKEKIA